MNGTIGISSTVLGQISPEWSIVQTGDYNGDGKSDIFFRDSQGHLAVWYMNGTSLAGWAVLNSLSSDWTILSQNAN